MDVVNSWVLFICIIAKVNSLGVYLSILCPSITSLFCLKPKCLESKLGIKYYKVFDQSLLVALGISYMYIC